MQLHTIRTERTGNGEHSPLVTSSQEVSSHRGCAQPTQVTRPVRIIRATRSHATSLRAFVRMSA